jgi:hypothetical protein
MQRRVLIGSFAAAVLLLLVAVPTLAARTGTFKAELTGYQEVPSISTGASGEFRATLATTPSGPVINYTLTYSNIEGGGPTQAHIHFGQKAVDGNVSAFLCGGGDKPACPPISGSVTGTIDASDVIGPSSQGIAPGEIDELIAAMRARVTYANVHSSTFGDGEIRGQIK